MICNKCKKENLLDDYCNGNKQYKTCINCRNDSRIWRLNNKNTVALYNKSYNENKTNNKQVSYVYAKKYNSSDDWIKFNSQLEAATSLGVYASNVSKVLNGSLKKTGGYIFKIENELINKSFKSWEDIKQIHNIENKCIGIPSKHRISHEIINNITGKPCCKCKNWKPLTEYNYSNSHWDNLRNDCKQCLTEWRKNNRKVLNENAKKYEKQRKLNDPEFKLLKTLRSRLLTALRCNNLKKNISTIKLLGCSISDLKKYLELKFKDGMTWENHGKWHIDHIKPCASFNLLNETEQQKCFHFTNLQPLWAHENLSKGCKIIDTNK